MDPYYRDGSVTIYHGDCRDVAPSLAPGSVDCLLTDPPYGMAFVSGWTAAKATVKSDGVRQGVRVVRGALNELQPTFSPDMHALVFCHWESWPDFYDNLCHLFSIRNALVWSKGGGGMGDLRHEYAKDYEVILFGAKSRGREIAGKRTGAVLKGHKRVPAGRRHVPFEKPVSLIAELIERHCPPGGLVLDPFLGSGPTLEAAKLTGRRAVGIELDERLCEIAARRLSQDVLDFGGAA
jgi:site-specific DNA-methyltransferase (adenine-specific)